MPRLFRNSVGKLGSALLGVTSRKEIAIHFAKKHQLIYFQTVHPDSEQAPVIRGTTASPDQTDENYCIGSHAGYDMVLVERTASAGFSGYKMTRHRWYVLQIDLHTTRNLPFIFLGTKHQTKAYYARVLTAHREIRYMSLNSASKKSPVFHAAYALLASPGNLHLLYQLFGDDVIESIAARRHPFAMEIVGDTITLIADAKKPSEQLLNELLHFGLWFAKTIDEKFS